MNGIDLQRTSHPQLLAQDWTRTIHYPDGVPEHVKNNLLKAVSFSGFGIDDPFEIKVTSTKVVVRTGAEGRTLAEYLNDGRLEPREGAVRGMLEELCQALERVHGRSSGHGGLNPFNIRRDKEGMLHLWSVPTAGSEIQHVEVDEKWEGYFCRPELLNGGTPSLKDDLFSLGRLGRRLLEHPENDISHELHEILDRCTATDSTATFSNPLALALALNPDSSFKTLRVREARVENRRGCRAYSRGDTQTALEHWKKALSLDWLDLPIRNNLAVVLATEENWVDSLYELERAYKLCPHHPTLNFNIGFCQWKLEDHGAASFWLQRAVDLNPWYAEPHRILAERAVESSAFEAGLKHARDFLTLKPQSRAGRTVMRRVLEGMGNLQEARCHEKIAQNLPLEQPLESHLITDEEGPTWGRLRMSDDLRVERGMPVMKRSYGPVKWLLRPNQAQD